MSRRRKYKGPLHPQHWEVSEEAVANGRHLTPSTEVSVSGERGRFLFLRHVRNTRTGSEWVDLLQGKRFRSFRPEAIKTVHRLNRTRENEVEK